MIAIIFWLFLVVLIKLFICLYTICNLYILIAIPNGSLVKQFIFINTFTQSWTGPLILNATFRNWKESWNAMENECGEVLNPDLEIIISQVYITPVCSNVFYLHIEYCCEIWGNIYKNNTVYIAYTNVHKILNHADCFMNI